MNAFLSNRFLEHDMCSKNSGKRFSNYFNSRHFILREFTVWTYILIFISIFPLHFKLETEIEVHKTRLPIYISRLDLTFFIYEQVSSQASF